MLTLLCPAQVELFDKDLVDKDDLIGRVDIPLLPLFKKGIRDGWVPIKCVGRVTAVSSVSVVVIVRVAVVIASASLPCVVASCSIVEPSCSPLSSLSRLTRRSPVVFFLHPFSLLPFARCCCVER